MKLDEYTKHLLDHYGPDAEVVSATIDVEKSPSIASAKRAKLVGLLDEVDFLTIDEKTMIAGVAAGDRSDVKIIDLLLVLLGRVRDERAS